MNPAPLSRPRVALIGGGKISEQHLRVLQSIDDVTPVALCDLSPALGAFAAERFGIPRTFTDHRRLLEEEPVDVVHVLTPPSTHARIVRDCLEAGRHVIVEKPVALSNAEFLELRDLARSEGRHLVENHNYRFNAPIRALLARVESGDLGTVREVEVRMALGIREGGRYADANLPHPSHRLPAGVLHEFITHLAYLLLAFMPEADPAREPSVRAAWRNHGGGDVFRYDELDALLVGEGVHGRIRFASRSWPDELSVTVRGSAGHARVELFHPMLSRVTRRGVSPHLVPLVNALGQARTLVCSGFGSLWSKIRNRTPYEGLDTFLVETYAAFRTGAIPPVGFDDMDRTTRLVDRLLDPEVAL